MADSLSYRFSIGSLDCTALLDGYEEISQAHVLFENAAPDELVTAFARYGTLLRMGWYFPITSALLPALVASGAPEVHGRGSRSIHSLTVTGGRGHDATYR